MTAAFCHSLNASRFLPHVPAAESWAMPPVVQNLWNGLWVALALFLCSKSTLCPRM